MYYRHGDEAYVKRVIGDSITDALEDALIRGKLRRRDIQYWYEKIGRLCDIPDLIPTTEEERIWFRLQYQFMLKETIRERLKTFDYSPVPIPEPPKEKLTWTKLLKRRLAS